MYILILNWRDILNPRAGGAEQLTHEVGKRWVKQGVKVTQISAGFTGAEARETLDGVRIVRLGRWWSVHFFAFWYYMFKLRDSVDIIIDEVHWFPFFARIYAKNKTVLLVCEVANNLFYKLFPLPIALWGRAVEKFYLWIYKNTPTMAISPSTRQDLVNEGFSEENITVLPMGVSIPDDIEKYRNFPKEKEPTLLYLGRINKQKGAEDALKMLKIVKEKMPNVNLWYVGDGKKNYVEELKSTIKSQESRIKDSKAKDGITNSNIQYPTRLPARQGSDINLNSSVRFYGFVSDDKKFKLLSRAYILIVPSVHEGWGLIVPEANSVGTPAVVYNVSGLRDTVKHNKTGLIVDKNPESMAESVIDLLNDSKKLRNMGKNAQKKAENYSWDETAADVLKVVTKRDTGCLDK